MNRARWDLLQSLFHDAVALPPEARAAFVERVAGSDPELVADLAGMLAQDARDGSLLDQGLGAAAHATVGRLDEATLVRQVFGPYRLIRILGEGGMGVVYLADRADLGSQAAIKILPDAWLSPARRDRFVAEQRTLAQLNDPGIARLYDVSPWWDTRAFSDPCQCRWRRQQRVYRACRLRGQERSSNHDHIRLLTDAACKRETCEEQ